MGRIPEVTLPDGKIQLVLEANIPEGIEVAAMCPYGTLKWRARGLWPDLYKNRGVLADIFKLSGGGLVHQVSLTKQICCWLDRLQPPKKYSPQDAEDLCFRIRIQMSHLRDHAVQKRRPPARFQMLQGVMSLCSCAGVTKSGEDEANGEGMGEAVMPPPCLKEKEADDVAVMPQPSLKKADEVAVMPPPCFQEANDVVVMPPTCVSVDMISSDGESLNEAKMFVTPPRPTKTWALLSPPKPLDGSVASVVSDSEIDKMLALHGMSAPDTKQYNTMKAKKRPAAAGKAVNHATVKHAIAKETLMKKPVGSSDAARRKRIYSKAYHMMRLKIMNEKNDEVAAKEAGKRAGRAAVSRAFD